MMKHSMKEFYVKEMLKELNMPLNFMPTDVKITPETKRRKIKKWCRKWFIKLTPFVIISRKKLDEIYYQIW